MLWTAFSCAMIQILLRDIVIVITNVQVPTDVRKL